MSNLSNTNTLTKTEFIDLLKNGEWELDADWCCGNPPDCSDLDFYDYGPCEPQNGVMNVFADCGAVHFTLSGHLMWRDDKAGGIAEIDYDEVEVNVSIVDADGDEVSVDGGMLSEFWNVDSGDIEALLEKHLPDESRKIVLNKKAELADDEKRYALRFADHVPVVFTCKRIPDGSAYATAKGGKCEVFLLREGNYLLVDTLDKHPKMELEANPLDLFSLEIFYGDEKIARDLAEQLGLALDDDEEDDEGEEN